MPFTMARSVVKDRAWMQLLAETHGVRFNNMTLYERDDVLQQLWDAYEHGKVLLFIARMLKAQ